MHVRMLQQRVFQTKWFLFALIVHELVLWLSCQFNGYIKCRIFNFGKKGPNKQTNGYIKSRIFNFDKHLNLCFWTITWRPLTMGHHIFPTFSGRTVGPWGPHCLGPTVWGPHLPSLPNLPGTNPQCDQVLGLFQITIEWFWMLKPLSGMGLDQMVSWMDLWMLAWLLVLKSTALNLWCL